MKIYKKILLFFISFFALASQTIKQWGQRKRPIITIWVHGTKLTPSFVMPTFFYRQIGLVKAENYDTKYHMRTIAHTLCQADPDAYAFEHFYIFGWSGKLSFKQRKKAAEDLYQAICSLAEQYKEEYNVLPRFRIITHSHGGNVPLNLPFVIDPAQLIEIDELILLACPVQCETKAGIAADCFKKVYSFYSSSDMFQVIDPQGLYKKSTAENIFSQRQFDHLDRLRQAKIKLNGRSLMHIDFLCSHFLKHLPNINKQIDHLYDIIEPSQITWPKQLDIRTKGNSCEIQPKVLSL